MTDADLELPFTITKSNGGPHDDQAFAAGWRLATIDAALAYLDQHEQHTDLVKASELDQLDLIAMRRHCTITSTDELGDGWLEVTIWKPDSEHHRRMTQP